MVIKKVLKLSDEEFNLLMSSGELLGAVKKSFENKEVDELSSGAKELLRALQKVIEEILEK